VLAAAGVLGVAIVAAVGGAWSTTRASAAAVVPAQDPAEAVMVAAGQWALERVPGGDTRLDPHRSGAGKDAARVSSVARSLGAGLGTLDELRQCTDPLDAASCRLGVDRLLAISAPKVDGDEARVKVYAWFRSSSPPVAQRSWDLVLRRAGGSWRVVSGG
jgi:hypothetical protein